MKFNGEMIPVYSDEIMREYREVLVRKKFKFDRDIINYILTAVERYDVMVKPSAKE